MSDTSYFTLAGILLVPIVCPITYWWTRFCLREYRRWAR